MYTLTALFFFIGFYLCYRTSKTVKFPAAATVLQRRLEANPRTSRWGAAFAFLAGGLLSVVTMGWGSGSFAILAYAMCAGSVVVLLAPFGLIRSRQMVVLVAISLLLEFLIRA